MVQYDPRKKITGGPVAIFTVRYSRLSENVTVILFMKSEGILILIYLSDNRQGFLEHRRLITRIS